MMDGYLAVILVAIQPDTKYHVELDCGGEKG